MITVTDIQTAFDKQKQFDFVISLIDTDWHNEDHRQEFMSKMRPKLWRVMRFEDVINPDAVDAPTEHNIQELLNIWQELSDIKVRCGEPPLTEQNVLVHCHGGIARSTALTIILFIKFFGMTVPEAFEKMLEIRPQMWPNDLILSHGDAILKLNGELIAFDKAWKKENLGKFWISPPVRIKP